ncbi:MAG TPA: hypothetical protein DEF47_11870 [Herpetosiphon sp.]|nr:hypothetical protein [Herpetosiphon sp.]
MVVSLFLNYCNIMTLKGCFNISIAMDYRERLMTMYINCIDKIIDRVKIENPFNSWFFIFVMPRK